MSVVNKKTIEDWRKVILGEQYDESIKELEEHSVEELEKLNEED
jgi:hypothetical protein